MHTSPPSLEEEFIVSVCSAAIMRGASGEDDMGISVASGGMILRYDSFDELVFVLINLSVAGGGEA